MKEKLYTIPLNDAVNANDECALCFIERNVEQDLLDYCIGSGSSYMEKDMRAITTKRASVRTTLTRCSTTVMLLAMPGALKPTISRPLKT